MFRNRQVYPSGKSGMETDLFLAALRDIKICPRGPDRKYPHVIAGKEIYALSGETYDSVDPNDPEYVIARFPKHDLTNPEERARLLNLLRKMKNAQHEFWKLPLEVRIKLVETISSFLRDRYWMFIALMALEGGKRPFPNGVASMEEAIEFCFHNIELVRQLYAMRSPRVPPFIGDINGFQWVPKGPIVDIEPFNFAIAIPMDKISSALLTGNVITMKASKHTPLLGYLLYQTIQDAFDAVGIENNGVVNFLSGQGGAIVDFLLEERVVNAYTFTGSYDVCCGLREKYCKPWPHGGRVQEIAAETSGKNPLALWKDADLDLALASAYASTINNNAQTCSHLGDLVLHRKIAPQFVLRFKEKLAGMHYGDVKNQGNECGALISKQNAEDAENTVKWLIDNGLVEVAYEKPIEKKSVGDFAPRLLRATPKAYLPEWMHKVRSAEIFAPVVTCWEVDSKDEMKQLCEAGIYGLTCGFFAEEVSMHEWFIRDVDCGGQIYINGGVVGATVGTAFGGRALSGSSGNGMGASSLGALMNYVSQDNVAYRFSKGHNKAQKVAVAKRLEKFMTITPSAVELAAELDRE
ncbi:MAG: Delta-1-pyrroline-5-carboxylate dehydrogenase [Candidatus Kaiserbacteria bacterium GW2011_GWB1_52_6]|nr:MAG: Delta-1-pyrroline-5-carboxylate dehydrogenase [Candidatus Kaiserbacteria bacterium GW2011_GWB1_52_6]